MKTQIRKQNHKEQPLSADTLLAEIKEKGAVIWGTGFVSGMFCKGLKRLGLLEKIEFFCDSNASDETVRIFQGKPVRSPDAVKNWRGLVCLAVHSSVRDEIAADHPFLSGMTVCWIYPYLNRICFGSSSGVRKVRVEDVLNAMDPDEYWLTFRYAAVKAEDTGLNSEDLKQIREIYIKCMKQHTSQETAFARYEQMKKVAESVKNGLVPGRICITQSLKVIDGLHRLAAVKYYGIGELDAQIYPDSDIYDLLFTEKNRLPAYLLNHFLTLQDIAILNDNRKELFSR